MQKYGNMENAETWKVWMVGMQIVGMHMDVASTYVLRPLLGIWCL